MKHLRQLVLSLLFCLFALASFAQDRGIIDCAGQSQIPAWTAPGSAWVIEQLACGQTVGIVGFDRGFFRIQIGERFAYVDAKFVRLPQSQADQERRIAELEDQVKKLKQQPQKPTLKTGKEEALSPAFPRAEIFGGYNFVQLDNASGNVDGWNAAVTGNLRSIFGLKTEISGLYGRDKFYSDVRYSGYSLLAGPQLSARGRSTTAFAHALFGVSHLGSSAPIYILGIRAGASFNAFSMALGGGLDWHGRRGIGWRVIQLDYLPWRAFGEMAHNFRASTGIVIRIRGAQLR